MAQTCTNAVVHSADFRIQSTISKALEEMGVTRDGVDRISLYGGCKAENHDIIIQNITASVRTHRIDQVVLTQHKDCAAYEGNEDSLQSDMTSLAKKVLEKFPELSVKMLLLEPVWAIREIRL